MAIIYTIPNWFSGYDIIMELLFALITGLVSFYSFKIYQIAKQRELRLFGLGFLLISFSYLLLATINFSIMNRLKEGVTILDLEKLSQLNYSSVYLHIILFLLGLATITYMALKFENKRLYFLLAFLSIISVLGPLEVVHSFYLPAAALILFIMSYYFINYKNTGNKRNLIMLLAFGCLLFSSLDFVLFKNPNNQYVIAHVFGFLAYIFILTNLLVVMRGHKKHNSFKRYKNK